MVGPGVVEDAGAADANTVVPGLHDGAGRGRTDAGDGELLRGIGESHEGVAAGGIDASTIDVGRGWNIVVRAVGELAWAGGQEGEEVGSTWCGGGLQTEDGEGVHHADSRSWMWSHAVGTLDDGSRGRCHVHNGEGLIGAWTGDGNFAGLAEGEILYSSLGVHRTQEGDLRHEPDVVDEEVTACGWREAGGRARTSSRAGGGRGDTACRGRGDGGGGGSSAGRRGAVVNVARLSIHLLRGEGHAHESEDEEGERPMLS